MFETIVSWGVFKMLATFVPVMVTFLLGLLAKKWSIEITAKSKDALIELVRQVIAYVEEKAAALKKQGTPLSSAAKLELAKAMLRERMPKLSLSQADFLVHSSLPNTYLEAGSVGATAKAEAVAVK